MKVKNPSTGNFEEVYVKALDSLPVGSEIDFTGSASDIPVGWEQVDSYSTDEVNTGKTWIDSKPIYRISFQKSKATAGVMNVIDIANLGLIVSCQTYLVRPDGYKNINNWGQEDTDFGTIFVSQADRVQFNSNYTGTLYGTIEYTKTTD